MTSEIMEMQEATSLSLSQMAEIQGGNWGQCVVGTTGYTIAGGVGGASFGPWGATAGAIGGALIGIAEYCL